MEEVEQVDIQAVLKNLRHVYRGMGNTTSLEAREKIGFGKAIREIESFIKKERVL